MMIKLMKNLNQNEMKKMMKYLNKKYELNGEKSQLKRTITQDQQNEKDNQYLCSIYMSPILR